MDTSSRRLHEVARATSENLKSGKTPISEILRSSSMKAASMENGMQYSAIYWETGHRTYLPFWASLSQKFAPKIVDDQIRDFANLPRPKSDTFIFYGSNPIFRCYFGDPDISMPISIAKPTHFCFAPTGTKDSFNEAALYDPQAFAFKRIFESAYKCDVEDFIQQRILVSATQK